MRPKRVTLRLERLPHGANLDLPAYQTAGAAGMDLQAAVPEDAPVRLKPKQRALVPTGLVMQLPSGYEAQVRPRSGLAIKHGIAVLNSPGTIDSDYRGEVMVILVNLGGETFTIRRGERIAQLVVQPVVRATLEVVLRTTRTKRGAGGFGSTGTTRRQPPDAAATVAKAKRVAPRPAKAKKTMGKAEGGKSPPRR